MQSRYVASDERAGSTHGFVPPVRFSHGRCCRRTVALGPRVGGRLARSDLAVKRPMVIAALALALVSSIVSAAQAGPVGVRPVKAVMYGDSAFVSAPRGLHAVGDTL